MGKKKSKREHKVSSGKRKSRTANRIIRECMMKIKRWQRYQEEIKAGKRKGELARWDTSGLEKHIKYMEKLL